MPSPSNLATPDRLLAEYAVSYRNPDFVTERILPIAPSPLQRSKYPVFGFEAFRLSSDAATATSDIPVVDYEVSQEVFELSGHSLSHPIGVDESIDPAWNRQRDGTTLLMERILLNKEKAAVDLVLDSANYGSAVYSTPSNLGADTVDVGAWLDLRKEEVAAVCGRRPNCWAIGRDTWTAIKSNAKMRTLILGLGGGVILEKAVAAQLELDDLIVVRTKYDSAKQGQTPVLSDLWTAEQGVLFCRGPMAEDQYSRPALGFGTCTFGKTFIWTPEAGYTGGAGAGNAGGAKVLKWRNQGAPMGTGGVDWLQVSYYYGVKITSAICGQIQTNLLGTS